jgi:hypothetical protein
VSKFWEVRGGSFLESRFELREEERKEEGGSEVLFFFVFCSVAKWKLLQLQVRC